MRPLHMALASAALTTVTALPAAAQTLPAPPTSPAPVINYEYDANGNPTRTIAAPGVAGFNFATTNSFDTLNRLKDSTDARAGKTQFGYNGREDVIQVTDPRNLVTQTPRTGLGDATSLVSPDTGTAALTYDAAGNLKTRTDSRGVLATYTYDVLNRLTGIVYSKSGSTSLTYTWAYDQTGAGYANGIGRLTSTTSPTSASQTTYDPRGRVLTDIQRIKAQTGANTAQVAKTVSYGYDGAGNVTSIVYPSGRKLVATYTGGVASAMTLAASTSATPVNLITGIQWEPFGGVKTWNWQMASGTQAHDRVYDSAGRLVRHRLGNSIRDISYDAGDRITAYTHYDATTAAATPTLNQGFSYDELGRLTGWTTGTSNWGIAYDANGNRTSMAQSGVTRTYTTASTSNRLTSLSNPVRSFGYDNAGNTTSDSASTTSTTNLAGRMATLVKAGITTTYSVDGMNRRVRKFSSTGASSTVIFVYDQLGQLIGEYNNSGATLREYVWLGSTPVAMFTPNGTAAPLVYYFHTDHLDTPRVVVDKNNAIRWRWLAEPFGTTAPETNPSGLGVFTQPLRFPGQYADAESGLNYNVHRDYDASIGRYTQSDPIGLAGGINTYAYVGSRPTSMADPFGLWTAVITNTGGMFGEHSAFFIAQGGQRSFLYDPAGDFLRHELGPGGQPLRNPDQDVLEGPLANLEAYLKFQGPDARVQWFNTSTADEERLRSKAGSDDRNSCGTGYCTACVRDVLRGVGPFSKLAPPNRFLPDIPNALHRELQRLLTSKQLNPQ
jgi:RHS repeat-associated protein